MSEKRAYTELHLPIQKQARRLKLTYPQVLEAIAEKHGIIEDPVEGTVLGSKAVSDMLEAALAFNQGNIVHLFMPSREFCDWLVACLPSFAPEYSQALAAALPGNPDVCVHFPTSARRGSVAYRIIDVPYYEEPESYVVIENTDWAPDDPRHARVKVPPRRAPDCSAVFMVFSSDVQSANTLQFICDGSPKPLKADNEWYAKLVVGLGLYLSCFPEQIKEGLPEDLKHAPRFKHFAKVRTLGVAPKVMQHDGPCPHFRVGHFRVLRSPRFTKKQFQTIFIAGMFVKGRAMTVLSTE